MVDADNGSLFDYSVCGIPGIHLCIPILPGLISTGGVSDVSGLHKSISLYLIIISRRLRGCEFKFLRSELGMTIVELSTITGVDADIIKELEKRTHSLVPDALCNVVRCFYLSRFGLGFNMSLSSVQSPWIIVESCILEQTSLSKPNTVDAPKIIFGKEEGKWVFLSSDPIESTTYDILKLS